MSETLLFHFEGALADSHIMNFYEAARFQYAASRLVVKLAKFRASGKFPDKITAKSNFNIQLQALSEGSFNINIEDKSVPAPDGSYVDMSLADLIAYVSERVIERIDETTLAVAKSEREDTPPVYLLDIVVRDVIEGRRSLDSAPEHIRDLVRRRIAESSRQLRLEANEATLSHIDSMQSQKLVSMSAPLIKEMTTALRESAKTLEIRTSTAGNNSPVVFLNREMASEIETASVDDTLLPILGDITQFNKENGWGKIKIEGGLKTVSFSVPSDILPSIKQAILDIMKVDLVYLKTYPVRDRAGNVARLIVVGILPTPTS